MTATFTLNPVKKGADNVYHKLEIPVSIGKPERPANAAGSAFCSRTVNEMQFNSNCQVDFSYDHGAVEVIACLIGPSEARFASKQDYTKAYIEVNLKVPSLGLPKADLVCNLRQNLEQIV